MAGLHRFSLKSQSGCVKGARLTSGTMRDLTLDTCCRSSPNLREFRPMIFYLRVEAIKTATVHNFKVRKLRQLKTRLMLTSCLFFVFQYNCCSLEIKEQDMTVTIRQAGGLLS